MITNQAYLFLIFIINGIVIGLLFDFFRILRKAFNTKDIITYIEDIVFWILTGITILYSIFIFNNGEIRLFMFLAILFGVIVYMIFISSHVIKVNLLIINFFKKMITKILKVIYIPIEFICKLIKKIFIKPIHFCIINIRKFSTNLFNNFQNKTKKIKKSKNIIKS